MERRIDTDGTVRISGAAPLWLAGGYRINAVRNPDGCVTDVTVSPPNGCAMDAKPGSAVWLYAERVLAGGDEK